MGSGQSTDLEKLALQMLQNPSAPLVEMTSLAGVLKSQRSFGYARRLFGRARMNEQVAAQPDLRLKLAQEEAQCTYQDPDQPASARYDRALEILAEVEDLDATRNQQTLGLSGAIYKRKWEADGQVENLYRAAAYYRRGHQEGVASDYGYTSINAAFILDLLAHQEQMASQQSGSSSEYVTARRAEADSIRREVIETLNKLATPGSKLQKEWWFLATIAEAHFGVGEYSEALRLLNKANALDGVPEWQKQSTTRQLAHLARLQSTGSDADSSAIQTLKTFLGGNDAAVQSIFAGKAGLALSGGGFRASLFHIGVLAKLAELDMLRNIEVISCVSGGSIIGAHYYLEVRQLLQTKSDAEITRQDYIDLVKRIERDFVVGVQRNIRTRVAAELTTNLKMLFSRTYSRTERAGELYEKELYSKINDGGAHKPRLMRNLFIQPLGEQGFSPKLDNWRRRAKVPILILNATSLNTGHNWQFTASWMGEPPAGIDTEIDGNDRLRRMYYHQAPSELQDVRLGYAVAASACVPGVFEPIVLDGLYPERTVRLVDGGVHDNQGIEGLLDQECTVVLVSDASGQMGSENDPSSGFLGVPLRSNTIFQARLREAQYHELAARRRSALLRGLMFIHLKKDLNVEPINWNGCEEPSEPAVGTSEKQDPTMTTYKVRKDVERCLAGIRTDLDSFCDVEANALMTSGYRMTEREFPASIQGFPMMTSNVDWKFLEFEKHMQIPEKAQRYMSILTVAKNSALRIWLLLPPLRATAIGLVIGLLGVLSLYAWIDRKTALPITIGMIGSAVVFAGMGRIVGPSVMRLISYRKTLMHVLFGVVMCCFGFALARVHLHVFDRWFQKFGRM
jgi:predicted acylesterase/phospholipase RssA